MTTVLENIAASSQRLLALAGPVADKELRVLSRRKMTYAIRSAYVLLLLVFIGFVWFMGRYAGGGSAVYQVSRVSESGKYIVTTIVWFQFIAAQLIGAAMLSTVISDEIHKRTLAVLMTTPISSFQIVMGKLVSRLLHLSLLLTISFPLLAIVRVFGGVSWAYVSSSLFVTLSAVVFVGSVSLFFSIHTQRANEVIGKTILACFVLYFLVPMGCTALSATGMYHVPVPVLSYINPFIILYSNTLAMLDPTSPAPAVSWLWHCTTMLCGAGILLLLSAVFVRRVGMRQIAGDSRISLLASLKARGEKKADRRLGLMERAGNIRQLKGPAIVWKDMVVLLNKHLRLRSIIFFTVAGIALLGTYIGLGIAGQLGAMETQIGFVCGYLLVGLVCLTSISASCITSEKEADTWPILLTTPLDNIEIVRSKIAASLLKCWIIWILLFGHIAVFTLARCIHPLAVIPLLLVIVCSSAMFAAVGVYISLKSRRTSTATSINSLIFLSVVMPFCCPLPFFINPLFLTGMILAAGGGAESARASVFSLKFSFSSGFEGFLISILIFTVIIMAYLVIAFIFYSMAQANVRRKIF